MQLGGGFEAARTITFADQRVAGKKLADSFTIQHLNED
jgi:hypothetical protein